MSDENLTITMSEAELTKFLGKVDKWNLHVRNLIKDLCDRCRLQIVTEELSVAEAFQKLLEQISYHFGHNRDILQNHIELVMRGGKVRAFTNGGNAHDSPAESPDRARAG
jgi:pimeloyl-CoA synthetase